MAKKPSSNQPGTEFCVLTETAEHASHGLDEPCDDGRGVPVKPAKPAPKKSAKKSGSKKTDAAVLPQCVLSETAEHASHGLDEPCDDGRGA